MFLRLTMGRITYTNFGDRARARDGRARLPRYMAVKMKILD